MEQQRPDREDQPPPESPGAPPLPGALDVDALRAELEEANRERGQFKNLLQRAQADYVNFKRRVEEERQEVSRQSSADLILRLMPVLDDFERALDHAPASSQEGQWLEGVALVYRNLRAALESRGLSRIKAQGQPFNPWEHEALFYEETSAEPEGKVLRVIREGYKLHDRILRPAQVSLARAPAAQPQADESSSS